MNEEITDFELVSFEFVLCGIFVSALFLILCYIPLRMGGVFLDHFPSVDSALSREYMNTFSEEGIVEIVGDVNQSEYEITIRLESGAEHSFLSKQNPHRDGAKLGLAYHVVSTTNQQLHYQTNIEVADVGENQSALKHFSHAQGLISEGLSFLSRERDAHRQLQAEPAGMP